MKDLDRRSVLACLSAAEVNLAEAMGVDAWWAVTSPDRRHYYLEFLSEVRRWQYELQNLPGSQE